jgi:hypothetical protein
MNVQAWSPNLTKERADQAGVKFVASKEEFFATSDIVSIHMVLAPGAYPRTFLVFLASIANESRTRDFPSYSFLI